MKKYLNKSKARVSGRFFNPPHLATSGAAVIYTMGSWPPASSAHPSGLPRGRGHGPFAQKGPLKNLRGRDKKRAMRGREGAVKEPQNL